MLQVSNVTNHTLNSTEIYQLFEYTRFGVWLMCIVGTFLNVLVITTILYYRRKKKSPSDTYICNLAVADLLIVVGLPFFLEYAKHSPQTQPRGGLFGTQRLFLHLSFCRRLFSHQPVDGSLLRHCLGCRIEPRSK